MVYAGIVAGGKGLRMKNADVPKQFLEICGEAIIVRTVRAFLDCEKIDRIYVGTNSEWNEYTQNLFEKAGFDRQKVVVLNGGKNRNETIFNIIKKIEQENSVTKGDIILTHDGVRPFVSKKIIEENIKTAEKNVACGTYIPAVDTIVRSEDGIMAGENLDRSKLFQAQTPQTFELSQLCRIINEMTEEEAEKFTDVCGIFSEKGIAVKMVLGDRQNFKITTDYDLTIANAIVNQLKSKC